MMTKNFQKTYQYLILFSVLTASSCDYVYNKYVEEPRFQRCIELNEAELYDSLINWVNTLDSEPDKYVLKELSKAYFNKRNYDSSIRYSIRLLELDSSNVFACYSIAINYLFLNKADLALSYVNKCIDLKGGEVCYVDCKLPKDEANFCTFDIDFVEIVFLKGEIQYNLNQFDQATKSFQFCIKKGFAIGDSYYYLASMAYLIKQSRYACEYMQLALSNGYEDERNERVIFCEN